jgi:hypothetical protein
MSANNDDEETYQTEGKRLQSTMNNGIVLTRPQKLCVNGPTRPSSSSSKVSQLLGVEFQPSRVRWVVQDKRIDLHALRGIALTGLKFEGTDVASKKCVIREKSIASSCI